MGVVLTGLYGGNKAGAVRPARADGPGLSGPERGRIVVIDALRGAAVLGMVAFHLDWDLAYVGWVDTNPAQSSLWMGFGHAVAATFLLLSGVGLVLARPQGPGAALRRVGLIAAAALLITLATTWLFPQDAIRFGILHCIAVTNLIGLVLLRAPLRLVLILAALSLGAPLALQWPDGPWWWMGLSPTLPRTLDYRPVLPWLGIVLLGVGLARLGPRWPGLSGRGALVRPLCWAGRHSLAVYLVHQPLLLGLLMTATAVRPGTLAEAQPSFVRQCVAQCVTAGAGRQGCEAACACVFARMSSSGPAGGQIDALSLDCVTHPDRPTNDVKSGPERTPAASSVR